MALNMIQMETVLLLRENYMYPKNEEEFFIKIKELDNNNRSIERVLKRSHDIYFSITQYYEKNKKEIKEILENII